MWRRWLPLRSVQWSLAAFLITLHFTLGITSALKKAPTADEYSYIATAYIYVKTGDFRLDRTHPPLIRLLIGLPLQLTKPWLPPLQRNQWDSPMSYTYGYRLGWEMLLAGRNAWEPILLLARIPILLLSCGLALLLYLWARDLYGDAGGLLSLFLYCVSPNMLAHARLATMDVGLCFFFFAALFAFYHYWKTRRVRDLVLAGAITGCALAAKVTAVLLLPLLAAGLLWTFAQKGVSLKTIPPAQYISRLSILLVSALAALLLIYGFPFKPCYYLDTVSNVFFKATHSGAGGNEIAGMPHLNYAYYLLGNYSSKGWPYYFLIAALVKTPLPVLLAPLGLFLVKRKKWMGAPDVLILGAIGILHVAAMFNRMNIGLRHVLPFYPFLFLYLGRLVFIEKRWIKQSVLIPLTIWALVDCLWIYPDYLAYFNPLAGGPANGQAILDDSNIDWGQDLARLGPVRNQYPNEPFYVATNWMFEPKAFHIDAQRLQEDQIASPPKGVVAVGKHWAIRRRIFKGSSTYFDWFEKYEPIGHVGHSILLYRFE